MKALKIIHTILVYAYMTIALLLAFNFMNVTIAYYRVMINIGVAQAEAITLMAKAVHGS